MARWARRPTRSYGLGSYTLISLSRQEDGTLVGGDFADDQPVAHYVADAVEAFNQANVINVPNDGGFCDALRSALAHAAAKQEAQHAAA